MDTKQLTDTLERIFVKEGERIVFWHDPAQEFGSYVGGQLFSPIEGVEIIRLDQTTSLEAKLLIEREKPQTKFLVYSPNEEPDYDQDWLLDIRLYSRSFRADKASIILDELGLQAQHLREHLDDRRKFFDNKDRLAKLKSLVAADDTAADLDRKMLAVVVKADQPELFNIIRTLFHLFTEAEEMDLRHPPQAWQQVDKFDLDKPFWQMVKTVFGYTEETPSLENFLIRLLVTDYAQHLKAELPTAMAHLVLPQSGRANAVVCLGQWRDSSSRGGSYDLLSQHVVQQYSFDQYLRDHEIDELIDVMTFVESEQAVASSLRDRVLATADTISVEDVQEIASRRQAGHWASPTVPGAPTIPRKALYAVYDALVAAAELFDLRNQHRDGFEFDDAPSMYRAYENELYRFDQLYRHFCEAADHAAAQHWDILKQLREEVEACYSNWYITTMALGWGKFVEGGLLSNWKIKDAPNEHQFFEKHVRPRLREAENRKAYVIISDAFRYEAAQELTQLLNGKYRFQAGLSSQLSVLPSYTALGMASLLPHKKLEYGEKGDVLVDGSPCASSEQRSDILSKVEGMVVRADKLLAMKKDEGRELVAGHKVIYVYHDEIDSRGEKASTEGDTFDAVRKAIDELADLIRFIINGLNGNYIVVTADHGFLFCETPPAETHKSKLEEKPDGTILAKKRYLLGRKLPDIDEAWHGDTKATADADGGMEFWIPKGANRFHFTGGARFIHGGAMLQEIVVPVITVRHLKGKSAQETKTKHVGVQVLGVNHRITTPKYRFQLLQTEPVTDRVKEITLKVAIYEGGEPVTNIEKVTFESTSTNMEERTREVVLVLQDRTYDKKTPYRLVLRDAETDIQHSSVPVVIDRTFTDDF